MTIYRPATPYSDGIVRPPCPRCGTRMMLARIALVPNQPDHDKRTFECPKCGNETSEVVKVQVSDFEQI
jgi:predicted RNA-binding Zn-ribbon protein involved in translation (DUF1610 family)